MTPTNRNDPGRHPAMGRARTPRPPGRDTDADQVGVNVQIPAPLHRRVRLHGVREGMTLRDTVIAALTEYVRR